MPAALPSKILVNYAHRRFLASQPQNTATALEKGGIERAFSYGYESLGRFFRWKHRHLLAEKRGAGYWIWKPHVIITAMRKAREGDWIFYSDSGSRFVAPIDPLVEILEEEGGDILAFEMPGLLEKDWTKRDLFVAMGCDSPRYALTPQVLSGAMLYRNTRQARRFVREWQHWCTVPGLVDDSPNRDPHPNYPGFREHRHDQSIFSLLVKKHGLPVREDRFVNAWVLFTRISK